MVQRPVFEFHRSEAGNETLPTPERKEVRVGGKGSDRLDHIRGKRCQGVPCIVRERMYIIISSDSSATRLQEFGPHGRGLELPFWGR